MFTIDEELDKFMDDLESHPIARAKEKLEASASASRSLQEEDREQDILPREEDEEDKGNNTPHIPNARIQNKAQRHNIVVDKPPRPKGISGVMFSLLPDTYTTSIPVNDVLLDPILEDCKNMGKFKPSLQR